MDAQMIKQINEAKSHIRKLKKVTPYMFDEYHVMSTAKQNLELAKQQYEQAKQDWKALGN